jgi:hypothetical protein
VVEGFDAFDFELGVDGVAGEEQAGVGSDVTLCDICLTPLWRIRWEITGFRYEENDESS